MAQKKLQVIEVQGVRGYLDKNNVAWLNIEDVARQLVFVDIHQKKVSATSGENFATSGENVYANIRWNRVNEYLKEFGFPHVVGKDDFIPENMFYRLAMKASNEAAQIFQAKVADEILPAIRKNGFYLAYEKDVKRIERMFANLHSERLRLECERRNIERARERFDCALADKKLAVAEKLRELASLATEDALRNDLIRQAAKILV